MIVVGLEGCIAKKQRPQFRGHCIANSKNALLREHPSFSPYICIGWSLLVGKDFKPCTLPKTKSLSLEIGRIPKGNEKVFQPSIFRCENVSFHGVKSPKFISFQWTCHQNSHLHQSWSGWWFQPVSAGGIKRAAGSPKETHRIVRLRRDCHVWPGHSSWCRVGQS